ncbi:MAG: tRNA dihydrouridine synthase DusB [Rickettsiales bacterium]|nr:tRNA dihydrouridine synthase DusB [Rickettsiales bacterium]
MKFLKEIKIGNHNIAPVILAPMTGVTDVPFRRLVKNFGAGLTISEMVASQAMILKTKISIKKSSFSQTETIPAVQLVGSNPHTMAEAAKLNEDLGAKIIDINFGCPAKKVVGTNCGSALMKDTKLAAQLIKSTVKAVKLPVTVKIRLGWDEQNKNAPEFAKIAEDLGAQMITVHGRTRSQMFTGKANWHLIREVKDKVKIPVIANGDIKSPEDAIACLQHSNASGVMIGRGAYGKPWLINQILQYLMNGKQISEPSLSEKLQIILNHYNEMLNYYGEKIGIAFSRKHIGWYTMGLPNSAKFRMEFNRVTSKNQATDKLVEYFNTIIDSSTLAHI